MIGSRHLPGADTPPSTRNGAAQGPVDARGAAEADGGAANSGVPGAAGASLASRDRYGAGGGEASSAHRRPPAPAGERQRQWKEALLRRLVATADVTAVLMASLAAGLTAEQGLATAIWSAALLPVWVMAAKLYGLYDEDHVRIRHLTSDELPRLFNWATVSAAGTGLALTVGPVDVSVHTAVVTWAVVLGGAIALRAMARAAWRALVVPDRGVVVGEGPLADALARKLALEPGHHLRLVASIPSAAVATGRTNGRAGDEPASELEATIRREGAERILVATPDLDEPTLARIVSACRAYGAKLSVAPPLRAMLGTAVSLSHLAELPVIEFRTGQRSRSTAFLKRAMDVTLAGVGLAVLAPVLAVIALVVRLDSPGPALFRQRRAGQGGVPFQLLKFRTMVQDAEERLEGLVRLDELPEPSYKLRADPRVTRAGRFLRSTSLDELPQLVNVLRGEMSLVGPRPEQLRLVERYAPELWFRMEMRPGVTGPMQVHGRGELTFQEWVAVEREYVENYSLRKDLRILLATPAAVAMRRGAF